jgi:RNA polymerase subunit RPABC4/transcription elongation factor Spt4
MFFFIAGIQPRTKAVDKTPRLCPVCGLQQAYLKRTDHYLSLFFIPLFPVKKGEPFLMCENCERVLHKKETKLETPLWKAENTCKSCGRVLERNFSYCPYCGKQT